jgi:hypothetical protein
VLSLDRERRATVDVGLALQLDEGALKHRRVGQVLLARGGDHHQSPGSKAAPDEREQPEAHLVGPMEVLEDNDRGLSLGRLLQEPAHALEEHQIVRRGRRVAVGRPQLR